MPLQVHKSLGILIENEFVTITKTILLQDAFILHAGLNQDLVASFGSD